MVANHTRKESIEGMALEIPNSIARTERRKRLKKKCLALLLSFTTRPSEPQLRDITPSHAAFGPKNTLLRANQHAI
jgi:hypothetical protein